MARRSKATAQLRKEVDILRPNRSKVSDGWIGDAAHAAGTSDHNPNSRGVVQAEDITDDKNTLGREIWNYLIASKDSRIKYVIFEGRMFSSYPAHGYKAWTSRPYSGKNAHAHHIHVSVQDSPSRYDDDSPWGLGQERAHSKEESKLAKLSEEAQEFYEQMYNARPKGTRPTSIWHLLTYYRKMRDYFKKEAP